MRFSIPDELRALVAEQRALPFIGPEVSVAAGFPGWDDLLRQCVQETEGAVAYDELRRLADDPLQIGEYLVQLEGGEIGPLRHAIEQSLPASASLTASAPHVELVNLGAPVIYTTNCDDLIESAFRTLGVPAHVVALADDVATCGADRTQVVKYYGDLRYEGTLVLTESAFYDRLAFESALDVKLRADLLGRGVLFLGYGDGDPRIRVIWAHLGRRARGIAGEHAQPSFMVRTRGNPVVEQLDRAAGLRTIVLDPLGRADTAEARAELLGEFLYELASEASPNSTMVGSDRPMLVSTALVRRAVDSIPEPDETDPSRRASDRPFATSSPRRDLVHLVARRIPDGIDDELAPLYKRVLGVDPTGIFAGFDDVRLQTALKLAPRFGASALLTDLVAWNLMNSAYRRVLYEGTDIDWTIVWRAPLDEPDAAEYLDRFEAEIDAHDEQCGDDDIAYAADIARRIERAQLIQRDSALCTRAAALLERAALLYPAISEHDPVPDGRPDVHRILAQINARRGA